LGFHPPPFCPISVSFHTNMHPLPGSSLEEPLHYQKTVPPFPPPFRVRLSCPPLPFMKTLGALFPRAVFGAFFFFFSKRSALEGTQTLLGFPSRQKPLFIFTYATVVVKSHLPPTLGTFLFTSRWVGEFPFAPFVACVCFFSLFGFCGVKNLTLLVYASGHSFLLDPSSSVI